MQESNDISQSPRRRSTPLVLGGVAAAVLACVLYRRPLSMWLRTLTPDGSLEPHTALFLDRLGFLVGLVALLALAAGFSGRLRWALSGAAVAPAPATARRTRWLAPACALFALALRVTIACFGDAGLGDDGARVVWLEQWLRDPHPVWTGLWLPAHLYLHALFYGVVRDPVWAGVLLSACATAGAVWILVRSLESIWGRCAAAAGGIAASVLPVSLAYGATPDVNPVFAFFMIAAVAAVARGARPGGGRWLVIGWFCLATATWMRFESLLLVPLVAALLWPQRRRAVLFAVAGAIPLLGWNLANALLSHGGPLRTMAKDPTLGGSPISMAFGFLGAIWQAVTLPVLVLGLKGMWRAMRARTGRGWMLLAWGHLAAMAGSVLLLGAGLQARYFILIGTVTAAYAGVGLAGIMARDRRIGFGVMVLALFLLAVTPGMYPIEYGLWMRHSPELRGLVDEVHGRSDDRDVVWIAEDADYFYACRVRPRQESYHALPRADSDPAALLAELQRAPAAVVVVEDLDLPLRRWSRFLELAATQWRAEPLFERGTYHVYELKRLR